MRIKEMIPHLAPSFYEHLLPIVLNAAEYHDLGKLCPNCQSVLEGKTKGDMPNHVDAGVALLLESGSLEHKFAANVISAHHIGLFDYGTDLRDAKNISERCPYITTNEKMCDYTDRHMDLIKKNAASVSCMNPLRLANNFNRDLFRSESVRLALSILVNCDHADTASNYGNFVAEKKHDLKPTERLKSLEDLVDNLQKKPNKRLALRQALYKECMSVDVSPFNYCSSVVGSGKTISVFAFVLRSKPERIIYVAPYVTITKQSTEVYKGIMLPGEVPEEIIGEHHGQMAVSGSIAESAMSKTWHTPVVCTTVVQLIETLSSRHPARLKKLHNIVGSHIIVDESHTVPVQLWPIFLRQLEFLVEYCGCKITFVSGTMSKPWLIKSISREYQLSHQVNPIVSQDLLDRSCAEEKQRIRISRHWPKFKSSDEFLDFIAKFSGPKLVIVNTVKNAAIIAKNLATRIGNHNVLHISTSLTPKDRDKIMERVKKRLANNPNDDWVLVATSCIESGVDVSFRHGFRELNGIDQIMQAGGRVNRSLEYDDSQLIVFQFDTSVMNEGMTFNHAFFVLGEITDGLFRKYGEITPEMSHEALTLFIRRCGVPTIKNGDKEVPISELMKWERGKQFVAVDQWVRVIADDKTSVLIDQSILANNHTQNDIIMNSVQIYSTQIIKNGLPVAKDPNGFHIWKGDYNDFIGYMEHLL